MKGHSISCLKEHEESKKLYDFFSKSIFKKNPRDQFQSKFSQGKVKIH